jgi:hypothetical protein
MNLPLPPNLAPWEAVLTGAALLVFWCFVIAMVSVIGGWHRLSKLYPAEETSFRIANQDDGKIFRWASLVMGPRYFPTNYGNCVNVNLSAIGVRLWVMLLVRPMHPPLLIPWTAIESCRLDKELLIFDCAAIQVRGVASPLRIFGRAGRAINHYWSELIVAQSPRE